MKKFKGIILSGGTGSRFFPVTRSISKQLLAIYNKPMIYYSLSVLMLMGIRDILVITRPDEKKFYKKLLQSGKNFGIKISYTVQKKPKGIAQSFILGENFIGKSNVALILGDNFFYSKNLKKILLNAVRRNYKGASIFICKSKKPKDFGVVEFSTKNQIKKIEEKPNKPKSNYVVTGLYLYDNKVVSLSKKLKFSNRDELEITDINNLYLANQELKAVNLGSKVKWMDNGNCESLLATSNFVKKTEKNLKTMILCPELIALKNQWISQKNLNKQISSLKNTDYGNFLKKI